jgi:hypothetical protein
LPTSTVCAAPIAIWIEGDQALSGKRLELLKESPVPCAQPADVAEIEQIMPPI